MMKEFFPDLPDDVIAELQRLAFHVVSTEEGERFPLEEDEPSAARRKALERRVEELIVENGWDHLRVRK